MDLPSGQLQTAGLQTLHADPPIDETTPSIGYVKEAVANVRSGKAAGISSISVQLLKACMAFRYHFSSLEEGVGGPYLEVERGPSRLQQLP